MLVSSSEEQQAHSLPRMSWGRAWAMEERLYLAHLSSNQAKLASVAPSEMLGLGRDSGLALATWLSGTWPTKSSPCLTLLWTSSSLKASSRLAESGLAQVQPATSQSSLSPMVAELSKT